MPDRWPDDRDRGLQGNDRGLTAPRAVGTALDHRRTVIAPARGPTGWTPALGGGEAKDARDVAREIAQAIYARLDSFEEAGLANGLSGIAVVLAYLEREELIHPAGAWREAWKRAQRLAAEVPLPATLYAGVPGLLWTRAHLGRRPVGGRTMRAAVAALHDRAARRPWRGHFDLISGLAGYGMLALELPALDEAQLLLEQVIARLTETATPLAGGVAWPLRDPQQAADYYDLGVAHGSAGVIGMLASSLHVGLGGHPARELLLRALEGLLATRLPGSAGATLPGKVADWAPPRPARTGWCYGPLGVAAVLILAADALGDHGLRRDAIELGRAAAAAPQVREADPVLCHGTAGIGLTFQRLHAATGEQVFLDAATHWYRRTLELKRPAEGLGGYRMWLRLGPSLRWGDCPGILDGAGGVALALAASASLREPSWDRMMVLSVPR